MDHLFAPPLDPEGVGPAAVAPYALRKVEASLLARGIEDVVVVDPQNLSRVVGPDTKVLGLTAHDPLGLSPVSTKLTMLFGGGPCWNAVYFEELGQQIRALRRRHRFAVIAGGPGIWQMSYERPPWVDLVYMGEAERDFPRLVQEALRGVFLPPVVQGRPPTLEEIPPIVHPSRMGEVQITRGCPRGCEFCSITPERYRTVPWSQIEQEIRVNQRAGEFNVELITDDVLLYGAQKLRTQHKAVVGLFENLKAAGAQQIGFAHISAPAVRESPETVRQMGDIAGWPQSRGMTPVVGLETGSVRIFKKYMPAKAYPFKPLEWPQTILEATEILNDAGIDPCYTMTIGFPDETDEDVQQTIALVQDLIDRGLRAFLFPLPVIPISTSRIRGNPMPQLERLPLKYWDLLGVCWHYDMRMARALLPSLVGRMKSSLARQTIALFVERLTEHVDRVFEEFRQTHGRSADRYRSINLAGAWGTLRSLGWLLWGIVNGRPGGSPAGPRYLTAPTS